MTFWQELWWTRTKGGEVGKVQLRLLPPSNLFLIVNSETVSVATLTGHWDPNGTPH